MKKSILLITLSLVATLSNAQNKENYIESEIKKVTVFFQGAEITREADVMLQAGSNTLRIGRLSQYLDPNSVQIEGSDAYVITAVNTERNFLKEADKVPGYTELKFTIDEKQLEYDRLQAQIRAMEEQRQFFSANKVFAGRAKMVTVDEFMDVSELYQNKFLDLSKKIIDTHRKAAKVKKELDVLKKKESEILRYNNKYTTDILVQLSATNAGRKKIRFTYVAGNASWQPSYDLKAKKTSDPLSLVFKGTVSQATGEDWNNVKMKLSTGNPTRNNSKPELSTWTLTGYDPAEYRKKSKAKGRTSAAPAYQKVENEASESGAAPAALDKEEDFKSLADNTVLDNSGLNVEYEIGIPFTIKSDGKRYSLEVKKNELTAQFSHQAFPVYDKSSFLTAQITDWEKLNLMAGQMNVYFQDAYAGTSWFDPYSIKDTLDISLGRDRSVVVERKKVKDYSKSAIIGSSRKVHVIVELNVKNTKNIKVSLDLHDHIPLSRNKQIEVELIENGGAKHDEVNGYLLWKMELEPGASKSLRFEYTVKFPKEKVVANF